MAEKKQSQQEEPLFNRIDRKRTDSRTVESGEGIYLHYSDGTTVIDASGGPVVVNIGYGRQEVADAAYEQMSKIAFSYETAIIPELFKRLNAFTPEGMNRYYPLTGGSEAVEAAIRFARHYHVQTGKPTKYKVIGRWSSYHGYTLGAASVTGNVLRRGEFEPLLLPFPHIDPCYCFRCPFKQTYPGCELLCATKLEECILQAGADTVAAFIAEPIVGASGGCLVPPDGYFQTIREICDRYDVLMIIDEVMTGFGRTGSKFCIDQFGVVPDLITTAKGMTSGYAPMGMLIVNETRMAPLEPRVKGFGSISTYSYHPVSAAVACKVLEILADEALIERSRTMGDYMFSALDRLQDHPNVGDIRGRGLFAGIELVRDKESLAPYQTDAHFAQKVLNICKGNGVSFYSGGGMAEGLKGDHIMMSPPFVITEAEIDTCVDVLQAGITEAAQQLN
ncbi:MAG: aspartate aminotransferase family protein [Pseudomonadales bacterium]|jgi:adenosylmethionine-8-amino-7-oxononanoate aminotransferase|nr:aspartate aminotransferase family protein [Pseudomonadales bacterium]MDP7596492.1 aspartate aminotransferase family protein [Pseudomonadales bacterium]HJN53321.1 aspartate aminotransferase family protein [Pseudomonadales bacterium]|tara:strand:+ start:9113 stop:10459 length:1347 start_codon:yes stop_codon:yes gene_type:complete